MFLLYNTQQDAIDAQAVISSNMGLPIERLNGYVMENWAIPIAAVEGKWFFEKPGAIAAAITGVSIEDIMDGVIGQEVEDVEVAGDT